jgi:hypothetical protein
MKKLIAITAIGIAAFAAVHAQQFRPVQETRFQPVTWSGSNAQAVASQLANITNLDGSLVMPTNILSGNTIIVIRIAAGTNGVRSITSSISSH